MPPVGCDPWISSDFNAAHLDGGHHSPAKDRELTVTRPQPADAFVGHNQDRHPRHSMLQSSK